jgi:acetyltransferase
MPLRHGDKLIRYFAIIDQRSHVAVVAATDASMGDESSMLVADGRCIRHADSNSAEFALVVADGWRRQGLGTSLVGTLIKLARSPGVGRLLGDVTEENKAMRSFAQSLGARLSMGPIGSNTFRVCLKI